MRETDGPNSNAVGEKLCKHKYSSYPYCYGEISTDTQGKVSFYSIAVAINCSFVLLIVQIIIIIVNTIIMKGLL